MIDTERFTKTGTRVIDLRQTRPTQPGAAVFMFEAVTEFGDYLMCARVASLDDDMQPVPVTATDPETLHKVWKPWLLRQTPFDGMTRDGITYETKPSGYTYPAGEVSMRLATNTEDAEEWQRVTPSYSLRSGSGETLAAGELVYAAQIGNGEYRDLNDAGRSWAAVDAPEVAT